MSGREKTIAGRLSLARPQVNLTSKAHFLEPNIYILNTLECYMKENKILTKKAIEIINKKLQNKKLTQQDSNYLSRFVRPKLRDIILMDAYRLLKKLEYNPRSLAIERKIKEVVLKNIVGVNSIIISGSAIQNNYNEYNDIDIIIATKKIVDLKEKERIVEKVKKSSKGLPLDIQIYALESIIAQYPHNPSLIYQLKDSKVIYGNLIIPKKISLSSLDLKMKLDWSEGLTPSSQPKEIYLALRNAMLVLLLMNKRVDNYQLTENLVNLLGSDLFNKLKDNKASEIEKVFVLNCLNSLVNYLEAELSKPKWGKIEIETH